jgi:ankyrin repeat protein
MHFTSFPPEIILLIGDFLASMADIHRLLQTNRRLYTLLIANLYQRNVKADGGSALLWHASRGNEAGVRNMLAAGANVNLRPTDWGLSTALLQAVHHNHTRVVQCLLENGALPDEADPQSRRPLTVAVFGQGDVDITGLLLHYGARANSVSFDKHAPLYEAIRSNHESKVALLLKYGADPHIRENHC